MLNAFKQYIRKEKLFDLSDRLLVAVSGGVDSIVLCNLLSLCDHEISIAHMNFQLRGEASDNDEKFVVEFAAKLKVQCYVKKVHAREYAEQNKLSIQMAARKLRYKWFNELAHKLKLRYLLTAHHADDNLETALFNLTKGTGIHGLRGILPKYQNLTRPLLVFTKREITKYAKENNLDWREDDSNQDDKYERNKIRNKVVPILTEINPDLHRNFIQSQKRFAGIAELLDREVEKIRSQFLIKERDDWCLKLGWLSNPSIDVILLHEVLKPFKFGFKETIQVFESLTGQTGKEFGNKEFRIISDRSKLIINKKEKAEFSPILINDDDAIVHTAFGILKIKIESATQVKISNSDTTAYYDFDKLTFPLKIRIWKDGDHFYPLGMKHRKKISDFLIDNKVSRTEKDKILVLESGKDLCWIVGYRIDERFKIDDSTEQVFTVEFSR